MAAFSVPFKYKSPILSIPLGKFEPVFPSELSVFITQAEFVSAVERLNITLERYNAEAQTLKKQKIRSRLLCFVLLPFLLGAAVTIPTAVTGYYYAALSFALWWMCVFILLAAIVPPRILYWKRRAWLIAAGVRAAMEESLNDINKGLQGRRMKWELKETAALVDPVRYKWEQRWFLVLHTDALPNTVSRAPIPTGAEGKMEIEIQIRSQAPPPSNKNEVEMSDIPTTQLAWQ